MTFRYVWNPFLMDYLACGWMFAQRASLGEFGGQHSWLMCWPCGCEPRAPRERA